MRERPNGLRLPHMIRFLAGHCALGVSIGVVTACLLVWLNVGGLGQLITGDGARRWVALGLLGFGFAITFGSLAMGSALFLLPRDEDARPPPR